MTRLTTFLNTHGHDIALAAATLLAFALFLAAF